MEIGLILVKLMMMRVCNTQMESATMDKTAIALEAISKETVDLVHVLFHFLWRKLQNSSQFV